MMASFIAYVRNVAMFVLLAATLELIIPSDNFKKFIHIVMGFVLIAIVVQPLANFFNIPAGNVQEYFNKLEISLNENTFSQERQSAVEKQNELIINNYKQRLTENMERIILENDASVQSADVTVEVVEDMDAADYGAVLNVFVTLGKNGAQQGDIVIKPVSVSLDEPLSAEREQAEIYEDENIKNLIKHFYNLSFDNIHITVSQFD